MKIKMTKYWFAPKTYGYGYVPISVEGWLATLILILIGIFLAYLNSFFNPYEIKFYNGLLFLVEILVLGFVLEVRIVIGSLFWTFEIGYLFRI